MADCVELYGATREDLGNVPYRFKKALDRYGATPEHESFYVDFLGSLADFRRSLLGDESVVTVPRDFDTESRVKGIFDAMRMELESVALERDRAGVKFDYERVMQCVTEGLALADLTMGSAPEGVPHGEQDETRLRVTKSKVDADICRTFGKHTSDISGRLYREYEDVFRDMCLCDRRRGVSIDTDEELNRSVWRGRAAMYGRLVRYLKGRFPDSAAVTALPEDVFYSDRTDESTGETARVRLGADTLTVGDMESGGFDLGSLLRALSLFRTKVLEDGGFGGRYTEESDSEARSERMRGREGKFGEVASWLVKNGGAKFARYIRLRGYDIKDRDVRSAFASGAYEGTRPTAKAHAVHDYLADGFAASDVVGRMADDLGYDPVRAMRDVLSGGDSALTEAVRDYFALTHFDELLEQSVPEIVRVNGRLRGSHAYSGGMYTRNVGGSGNKKGYGENDKYDAKAYTTKYVDGLLADMEVFRRNGGSEVYVNRRMDSTGLVGAFSKLARGIIEGRYVLDINDYVVAEDVEGPDGKRLYNADGTPQKRDVLVESAAKMRREIIGRLGAFGKDPVGNTRWLFNLLFGRHDPKYGDGPLIDLVRNAPGLLTQDFLSESDKDILYSFHRAVTDETRPDSVVSVLRRTGGFAGSGLKDALDVLSGYLGRNSRVRHLTTSVGRDGDVTLRVEKGYIHQYEVWELTDMINSHANGGMGNRAEADRRWGFRKWTDGHENTHYMVTLGDGTPVEIVTRKEGPFGIMYGDEQSSNVNVRMEPSAGWWKDENWTDGGRDVGWETRETAAASAGYWERMRGASVDELRGAMMRTGFRPSSLSAENRALYETLRFVDEFLGLGVLKNPAEGLAVLGQYSEIYSQRNGFGGLEHYMMPLVKMAMRGAYANRMLLKAEGEDRTLKSYLKSVDDDLLRAYNTVINTRTREPVHVGLTYECGDYVYNVASGNDEAVALWADARDIYDGKGNRSTYYVKGRQIPADTVNTAANSLYKFTDKVPKNSLKGMGSLLHIADAVTGITHVFRFGANGRDKSFSELGPKEMLFNAVVNWHYGSLAPDGAKKFTVMTTSFGEKNTTVTHEIDCTALNAHGRTNAVNIMTADREAMLDSINKALGGYYRDSYSEAGKALRTCLEDIVESASGAGLSEGEAERVGRISEHLAAEDADGVYRALKLVGEQELLDAAQRKGVRLTRNLEYRVGDGGVLSGNELLRAYAQTYGDPDRLAAHFASAGRQYVESLLREGVHFTVWDAWDRKAYHTGDAVRPARVGDSANPVYTAVRCFLDKMSYYDPARSGVTEGNMRRSERYYRDWTDDDGLLVLAKQGGRDITDMVDYDPDSGAEFVLNPMLERYVLVEGLVSRGLNAFVAGSEVGNEVKSRGVLNAAKRMTADDVAAECAGIGVRIDRSMADEVVTALGGMTGTDDIGMEAERLSRTALPEDPRRRFFEALFDRAVVSSRAQAQDINRKRAGGMVSPGQDAIRGLFHGVGEEIGVCAIENIRGRAWGYNGNSGDVDAGEGASWTTFFQNWFENVSFGDHASGKVMKTMLYHMYEKYGTIDYIKHASNAITNATMRLTENNDAGHISHRQMFKKMTDAQWRPSDGIILTANRLDSMESEQHVLSRIFRNRPLYYEDFGGAVRRIDTLGADENMGWTESDADGNAQRRRINRLYYTMEGDAFGGEAHKVYHLFYDRVEDGRVVETSVHRACGEDEVVDVWRSLLGNGDVANVRTINSLYELHTALGGMWCVDRYGNQSEENNEVICRFMDYVVTPRRGVESGYGNPELYDPAHFIQPLKLARYHKGYIVPTSTMKRGAANINPLSRLEVGNVEPLRWFVITPEGLAIQMEAGKILDDADGIVGTQMLAALASGGVRPEVVNEVNTVMGMRMMAGAARLREAVGSAMDGMGEEAIGRLYGVVGEIFARNVGGRTYDNIAGELSREILPEFRKGGSHIDDAVYLPFSTEALYNDFIGGLSNYITNELIRIRMRGAGYVMTPSYRMVRVHDVWLDGGMRQLMPGDVLKRARDEYREETLRFIRSCPEYRSESGTVRYDGAPDGPIDSLTLDELVGVARKINVTGRPFSDYYTDADGRYAHDEHIKRVWLERRAAEANHNGENIYYNRDYFVPADIVDVLDASGRVVDTVELTDGNYTAFKRRGIGSDGRTEWGEGYRYRINVTRARDLKPTQMRWQYEDVDEDGVGSGAVRWANWFDLAHVEDAMSGAVDPHDESYTRTCEAALRMLFGKGDDGDRTRRFTMRDAAGNLHTYRVRGRIEKSDPETVLGNLYADVFRIRGGDSLYDVLSKGVEYFSSGIERTLRVPVSNTFDLALLRTGGRHTYIKFGWYGPDSYTNEEEWDNTRVADDGEIWVTSGMRDMFRVGRWVDDGDTDLNVKGRVVVSASGRTLDPDRYRVLTRPDGTRSVQRRVDYIRRYRTVMNEMTEDGEMARTADATLYNVADASVFAEAYGGLDADGLRERIVEAVREVYGSDDHVSMEVSQSGSMSDETVGVVRRAIQTVARQDVRTGTVRDLMLEQDRILGRFVAEGKWDWDRYFEMKQKWYGELGRERWTGFRDSLDVVSCRIPTSGLQSFMNMRTVGWTGDKSNNAYVSHFQIYLQGSDYDIDKANVTGQEYDSIGRYVGWSPFFDNGSLELLKESKRLPVPKGHGVEVRGDGVDITPMLLGMMRNSLIDDETGLLEARGLDNTSRRRFLVSLKNALYALEGGGTVRDRSTGTETYGVTFDGNRVNGEALAAAIRTLNAHEAHRMPLPRVEDAYNNSIMSRIQEVAGDIRNLVQANIETSTRRFADAADRTSQNAVEMEADEDNPAVKFISTYGSKASKKGVGIAANGNKVFDNWSQYVTWALATGDAVRRGRTSFSIRLGGIEGRAGGEMRTRDIRHVMDLNMSDTRVMEALAALDPDFSTSESVRGVKEWLAQFINVATDDPKLHILQRINGVTELLSDYCAMMMLGFRPEDCVAFMTTPYIDALISAYGSNMFERGGYLYKIDQAVDIAAGMVMSKQLLHGVMRRGLIGEDEYNEFGSKSKINEVRDNLLKALSAEGNGRIREAVEARLRKYGKMPSGGMGSVRLDDLQQAFAMTCAERVGDVVGGESRDLVLMSDIYGKGVDQEEITYVREVDGMIRSLRSMAHRYMDIGIASDVKGGVAMIEGDRDTYRTLRGASNELTTLAVAYLKFNQGMVYSDFDLVKRVKALNRAVGDREKALGLDYDGLATRMSDGRWFYDFARLGDIVERIWRHGNLDWERDLEAYMKAVGTAEGGRTDAQRALVARVDAERAEIGELVRGAFESGVAGGFDIRRALNERPYMDMAVRYLDRIKSVVNTLDMIDSLPHYRAMLDLFNMFDNATDILSMRRRMIKDLAIDVQHIDEGEMRKLARWTDRAMALDYLAQRGDFVLDRGQSNGFNESWDEVLTDTFDLGTDYGQGGFCRWFVERFLPELRSRYPNNGFVRNLVEGKKDGRWIVRASIDMRNPNSNERSSAVLADMRSGLRRLKSESFSGNGGLSVADVVFLYNLVENGDSIDHSTLTMATVTLGLEDGEAGRFAAYKSSRDRTPGYMPRYYRTDYGIMTAPVVDEWAVRYQTAPFIKVRNAQGDVTIMRRNEKYNSYSRYNTNTAIDRTADGELKDVRRRNFLKWSPVEMPEYMRGRRYSDVLLDANVDREALRKLIVNDSIADLADFTVGRNEDGRECLVLNVNVPEGGMFDLYEDGLVWEGEGGYKGRINLMELPEGTDVDSMSYDDITDLIVGSATPEQRGLIVDALSNTREYRMTQKDISGMRLVSNAVPEDLFNIYGIPKNWYDLGDYARSRRFTLLVNRNVRFRGDDYSGRFVYGTDGNGVERVAYPIGDAEDAKRFLGFVNAVAALDGLAGDGVMRSLGDMTDAGLSKSDARLVAEVGRLKGIKGYKELFGDFLERSGTYGMFEYKGRMYSSQKVMNDAWHKLTGNWFVKGAYDLTDAEQDLWRVVGDKGDPSLWEVGRVDFYDFLKANVPGFDMRKGEFMTLGWDGMYDLLYDSSKGIFRNSPDLFGKLAKSSMIELTNPTVSGGGTSVGTSRRYVAKHVAANWDGIVASLPKSVGAADARLLRGTKGKPVTFRDFGKYSAKERERLFNLIGYRYAETDEGGVEVVREVKAEAWEKDGKTGVRYYYEEPVEKTVAERFGKSHIKFRVGMLSLGDRFDFDRSDYCPLIPVDDGSVGGRDAVRDGRYHGVFVYRDPRRRGAGARRYATARSVQSPEEDGRSYWTLEEALDGIDRQNLSERISNGALVSVKQGEGYITHTDLEGADIYPGQVLTVLDRPLPQFEYSEVFGTFRSLMGWTGRRFHERFDAEIGTERLYTPEMMASYLMEQYYDIYVRDGRSSTVRRPDSAEEVARSIVANHLKDPERWNGVVSDISEAGTKSYKVDYLFYNFKTKTHDATLMPLLDDGLSINVRGDRVGKARASEVMSRAYSSALEIISRKYAGGDIVAGTVEELRDLPELKGLGIRGKLDSTDGIVMGNRIYINLSRQASEMTLYHELLHVLLGVVRNRSLEETGGYDEYEALIGRYRAADPRRFDNMMSVIKSRYGYSGARTDIEEETFCRLMAQELHRSVGMHVLEDVAEMTDEDGKVVSRTVSASTGLDEKVMDEILSDVVEVLRTQYARESAGGGKDADEAGFTAWLKSSQENGGVVEDRKIAGAIRQLLLGKNDKMKLEEHC